MQPPSNQRPADGLLVGGAGGCAAALLRLFAPLETRLLERLRPARAAPPHLASRAAAPGTFERWRGSGRGERVAGAPRAGGHAEETGSRRCSALAAPAPGKR